MPHRVSFEVDQISIEPTGLSVVLDHGTFDFIILPFKHTPHELLSAGSNSVLFAEAPPNFRAADFAPKILLPAPVVLVMDV